MSQLSNIIEKLKVNGNVDCVFLTGSHGVGDHKSYSDIDLVIILRKNVHEILSVYTFIDNLFADIFFFDFADIEHLEREKRISANKIDGSLFSWLTKANIQFDKSGRITRFIKTSLGETTLNIDYLEKFIFWQQINYNYIANKRYFESSDPLYHEALEMRLALYSIGQLLSGYLCLRDIPWRGEKNTVKWFKENDPNYYNLFEKYISTTNLKERFRIYSQMVCAIFPKEFKLWDKDTIIALSKQSNSTQVTFDNLSKYWQELIS